MDDDQTLYARHHVRCRLFMVWLVAMLLPVFGIQHVELAIIYRPAFIVGMVCIPTAARAQRRLRENA